MNHSTEPSPSKLSYGAELEFAVLWVYADEVKDGKKYFKEDSLPEPIRIQRPRPANIKSFDAEARVRNVVRNVLAAAGLPTKEFQISPGKVTLDTHRVRSYLHWQVDYDDSIEADDLKHPLQIAKIEVTTPVAFESPASFELVRHAVNVLTKKMRLLTNITCGLHCHIGHGGSWMQLQWLKRLGSLYWASDKLLASLNPPVRQVSYFCPSIRILSRLALESQTPMPHDEDDTLKCGTYIATNVRFGERPILWRESHAAPETIEAFRLTREPGCFDAFIDDDAPEFLVNANPNYNSDPRIRVDPDDQADLTDYTFAPLGSPRSTRRNSVGSIDDTMPMPPDDAQVKLARRIASLYPVRPSQFNLEDRLSDEARVKKQEFSDKDRERLIKYNGGYGLPSFGTDRGTWAGAAGVYPLDTSCEVSSALTVQGYRANYNFNNFSCRSLSNWTSPMLRTIEWRAGENSMSAKWIATWLAIAVGVSRFSIQAPVSEFLRVLANCEYHDKGGSYDVVDFLEDIGLFAEARLAAEMLRQKKDEYELVFEGAAEEKQAAEHDLAADAEEERMSETAREPDGCPVA
ncbi:hypothetical protein JX265_013244 [Neoarthrinium moseri]|uniref:Uncharacterized protein n=1 Tax=Neoarthrinium moseri TaxID=1658444 RepID=A0A9Q0AIU0_9PEZI|nr:uncharacterized protein JN550_006652 [Neoarthrinium moseri]KAI1851497.1 hypothetical protein JX265_013244 [Neoarthrinium moseri]KAI1867845.1 hypothetical protein JN550_006652 [Neoarthrinium moseri]